MSTNQEDSVIEFTIDGIWDQLERMREQRGWKPADVAHHAGLSAETYRTIKQRSPRQMKLCEARRLFKAFGYELTLTASSGLTEF